VPVEDEDISKELERNFRKQKIRVETGARAENIRKTGHSVQLTLTTKDGKQEELEVEKLLIAVGRKPNTDKIGLENTKVELDKRGFAIIDRQQRTADPHISAIGDVAGEPMLAHKAMYEGRIAVEVILGEPAAFDALAVPAVVFTDPEIAWAGVSEEQAKREGREVEIARYPWAAIGRAVALGRTEGLTKLVIDPHSERILGIGIVGLNAGDMISEGVLAIEMGCTVRDLTASIHPHPTLSETVSGAGEVFLGLATELYRPRREKQEA